MNKPQKDTHGTYVLIASLLLTLSRWLIPNILLSALVFGSDARAQYGASFVSQNVPTSMTAGQRHPVSVTMRNTGNSIWTNTTGAGTPNSVSLGSQNPQDNTTWGLDGFPNRVPIVGSVGAGATTTFNFDVVAPATPGTYSFQWQMVNDFVAWFGAQTPNVQVVVSSPSGFFPDAQFVSQNVPASMTAGQRYPVSVTMRNTGNTTWTNTTGPGTPNAYSLGSQSPQDNLTWGLSGFPNRVPVIGSVSPGATTTFTSDVVAPATPGTHSFQWQMVNDFVTWFGAQTPTVQVAVSSPSGFFPDAQFVSQSVPTSMTAGQRYPVSVTMRNTGDTTWTNTTGPGTPNAYSLGSQSPQDNLTWGLSGFPNRVPVIGSVAPGGTATFTFDVVAPATPGVHNFQWQMVDDFVAWFGAQTQNVEIITVPPPDFLPGPIDFSAAFLSFAPPVIGDVNRDGWLEPLGTINNGNGQLMVLSPEDMGLSDLFTATRPNDVRLADLNGDGCQDLVAQGYSAYSASPNVESRALLYFNNGTGRFTADASFANLNFNGRGEGLVAADFNNDGALDLYLPYYTFGNFPGPSNFPCIPDDYCPNAPQSSLLLNDGTGRFTRGDVPGTVDLAAAPGGQPEGVQAVDINDDGRIDIYTSGYLFLNRGLDGNGRVMFDDCNCGVPRTDSGLRVDEGAKFLDWNNDGKLDLILHDPSFGPALYENVGSRSAPQFRSVTVRADGTSPMFAEQELTLAGMRYRGLSYCASYGMNVYDLDNDGLEDLFVAGSVVPSAPGCDFPNVIFRNDGSGFDSISAGGISGWRAGGVLTFADINRDGAVDAMYVGPFPYYFTNATSLAPNRSFTVEVLGGGGQSNQYGRVITVSLPVSSCTSTSQIGCTLTRVVDGGSGYHSQTQYAILVGTPFTGAHLVQAVFPHRSNPGTTVTVSVSVNPGQYVQIFAPSVQHPNGRAVVYDAPPTPSGCPAS